MNLSMESTPAGSRSIKDHKIIIGKLLLILRLLNSDLVKEESSRCILIPKAITWAVDVFLAPTDIEATRLACSVLNAACTALWNDGVIGKYQGDMEICYSLAKFYLLYRELSSSITSLLEVMVHSKETCVHSIVPINVSFH